MAGKFEKWGFLGILTSGNPAKFAIWNTACWVHPRLILGIRFPTSIATTRDNSRIRCSQHFPLSCPLPTFLCWKNFGDIRTKDPVERRGKETVESGAGEGSSLAETGSSLRSVPLTQSEVNCVLNMFVLFILLLFCFWFSRISPLSLKVFL